MARVVLGGHINVAADLGPRPQGESILRELARGALGRRANAPWVDLLIDRATARASDYVLPSDRCLLADQPGAPTIRPVQAGSASMPP